MTDAMRVPAVCETCGTVFPSGFALTGADVRMIGNRSGPCPKCGGTGRIPDGTYQSAVRSIQYVRDAVRHPAELSKLADILKMAQGQGYEPKRLAEAIELDAPTFSKMSAFLPQTRAEVQNYLVILLQAIAVLLEFLALHPASPAPSVYELINTVQQQAPAIKSAEPGRNAFCPCGGGKKYKNVTEQVFISGKAQRVQVGGVVRPAPCVRSRRRNEGRRGSSRTKG